MSAGWYPDPSGRFEYRYHNGLAWTGDVATDGERFVDHGLGTPVAGPGSRPPGNGIATAALVCGLVGLVICWLPVLFAGGFVLGVLGIVFGAIGRRRAHPRGGVGSGFALAGMLAGGAAVLGSVGGLLLTLVTYDAIDRYENPAPHTVSLDRCEAVDGRVEIAGSLRNDASSGDPSDFNVVVRVDRPGGRAVAHARIAVDDVAPGSTATFELSRMSSVEEVTCSIVEVTGPLPFGVAP